ncbi:hypothetical protein EZV62_008249 [Acer yangbiense]|uniref:Uncharacterized protein n=1 Tax=Acer yangbiense TaxID=1000413 RepID=A0A5C7ICU8_9ROSI|nr:hypothetical protein EZV62_008249 [Acer yangbiense]
MAEGLVLRGTMRAHTDMLCLWDLATGTTTRCFIGHTKDVLSVAFSMDNLQIVFATRYRTIKLWNTLGECKYTIQDGDSHTEWISATPAGHTGYVNTVAVSPDGSLCASGGKGGIILLWDLAEGKRLYCLDAGSVIHVLCFSPNRYWLCAATEQSIKIWDLESKSIVEDLKVNLKTEAEKTDTTTASTTAKKKNIYCTSLSWSADGSTLFSGYTDGVIKDWGIGRY